MTGRREELLDGAVAYVLEHGVGDLSLRPLGRALGTSDRMLLYYFRDRDELVTAVLGRVGDDLAAMVEQRLPAGKASPDAVLASLGELLSTGLKDARLRLWLEVAGLAAQDREPFKRVARVVVSQWIATVALRLDVEDPATVAAALLTVADGAMLLAALGHRDESLAGARWLLQRLGDP